MCVMIASSKARSLRLGATECKGGAIEQMIPYVDSISSRRCQILQLLTPVVFVTCLNYFSSSTTCYAYHDGRDR